MHQIEPFFNWRHLYMAEEDERSPFYGREYSEFEFTNQVYNYLLHPQWDEFGSSTLFMKLLFADYEEWFEEVEDGWIAFLDFREHVLREMKHARIDWYVHWGGMLDDMPWRTFKPRQLFKAVGREVHTRIG